MRDACVIDAVNTELIEPRMAQDRPHGAEECRVVGIVFMAGRQARVRK